MEAIIKEETIVFSEQELLETLKSSMGSDDYNDLVIMAGHFMLFFDSETGRLVPGIFEEIESKKLKEQVKERVGIFPSYTWRLGVQLGDIYQKDYNKAAKLLLLVNDWQYVPDRGKASDYRADFYKTLTQIPLIYQMKLQESPFLSEKSILPSRKHELAFPETWLKYRFQNAAARLVKKGKLKKRYLEDQPGKSEISFTDLSGTSLPLISCGITGCAGEITEMISEVHRAGGRYLIIFAPSECHAPIQTGVEIALSLYELKEMQVIVADLGGSGEMTEDEIFDKGISLAMFRS